MEKTIEVAESTFSVDELQQMLVEKQIEANEAKAELLKQQAVNNSLITRSLRVVEENQMYKASPALAEQMAEMSFQMELAKRFIDSKAFKADNPEQAYVKIKAGSEMGMKPIEAMQALYFVNGTLKFFGDKMTARITGAGYKIEYLNETENGVTVRVTNKDGFEAMEKVTDQDQIIKNSKAAGFAKKNKMRFHGVRMIASFHLPHLFGSVSDEFTSDFVDWQEATPKLNGGIDLKQIDQSKEAKRISDHIENATLTTQLGQVEDYVDQYGLRKAYTEKSEILNAKG